MSNDERGTFWYMFDGHQASSFSNEWLTTDRSRRIRYRNPVLSTSANLFSLTHSLTVQSVQVTFSACKQVSKHRPIASPCQNSMALGLAMLLGASLVLVRLSCFVQVATALVQVANVDQIRSLFKDGVLLPGSEDIVLTTHLDLTGPTAPSLVPVEGNGAVSSIRVCTCCTHEPP
jgi:hypothetical protein